METSLKTGGLWGLHTATKIMRSITSAPSAIPRIAALEIVTVLMETHQFDMP